MLCKELLVAFPEWLKRKPWSHHLLCDIISLDLHASCRCSHCGKLGTMHELSLAKLDCMQPWQHLHATLKALAILAHANLTRHANLTTHANLLQADLPETEMAIEVVDAEVVTSHDVEEPHPHVWWHNPEWHPLPDVLGGHCPAQGLEPVCPAQLALLSDSCHSYPPLTETMESLTETTA